VETVGATPEAAGRRDAMLEALAFAAQRFLERPTWSECLDDVVCRLGESVGASRAYVFENRAGGGEPTATLRSLWLAQNATSPFSPGDELGYRDLERWVERLSRGDVVAGPARSMPEGERAHLEPSGIRSLLLVPVTVAGAWWGYVGFDDCLTEREWPPVEVDLLRAAAGTLSAAIVRERAEAELRETEERYRALAEHLPAVTYREPLELTSGDFYISPRVREVFGYTPEEWTRNVGVFWHDRLHPEDRERVLAADAETNRTREPYVAEYRFRKADGSYVWIHDEARLVLRPGGTGSWQGFFLDITERKEAEDKVARALAVERDAVRRLQAVDEMKNTFLQAVSHDLRTPLAAILGLAVTLERGEVDLEGDEARDLAGRIAANARKLDRMVTDLLDLDRLSRGIVEPKLHPTDVTELVQRVVSDSELHERGRVIVEGDPLVVNLDPAKVERIVENLLANASRHTPDDTRVVVRVLPAEGGVTIVVDDDGPGIPSEMRRDVFEPFRQGPDAPDHAPGVGIGLALVARFAELMGGRAWVEESSGGGASFRVYLRDGPRTSAEVGTAG
jgi:PAS domain S-box-containing protein